MMSNWWNPTPRSWRFLDVIFALQNLEGNDEHGVSWYHLYFLNKMKSDVKKMKSDVNKMKSDVKKSEEKSEEKWRKVKRKVKKSEEMKSEDFKKK